MYPFTNVQKIPRVLLFFISSNNKLYYFSYTPFLPTKFKAECSIMFPAFNVQTFFLFNSVLNGMFPTSLCRGILPGARVVAWKYATQTTKNWRFQRSVDGQRFAVQTIRQWFFLHTILQKIL